MDLLTLNGVSRHFGGLVAVDGVSFAVRQGTIHALIGPNGSGKTTCFNVITGFLKPTAGVIHFAGRPIHGLPSHAVARLGIARTFQNLKIFREMTVLDNVLVGRHYYMAAGFLSSLLALPAARQAEAGARDRCLAILDTVGLSGYAQVLAKNLPYGQQRLLEIARALATEPKLLLLDEPAAGLNSGESADLVERLGRIRAGGVTIILVEHDLRVVMGVSERITVLDHGRKIAEGTPDEVQRDPMVIEAYLGRAIA